VSGKPIADALRSDILAFYSDLGGTVCDQEESEAWQQVLDELGKLKDSPAAGPEPEHPE
jgi:hypothetical protein